MEYFLCITGICSQFSLHPRSWMDSKISFYFWEITEMISRGRVLGPTALGSKLTESDSTDKLHVFKVDSSYQCGRKRPLSPKDNTQLWKIWEMDLSNI